VIGIAGSVAKSWLAKELGVRFDRAYYFDAQVRQAVDQPCRQHVARVLADLPVCYTESNLGRAEWLGADQVLIGGIQPNLIVGLLVGAEFVPTEDADADISPLVLTGRSVADLPAPAALLDHPLVHHWEAQIRAIQADPAHRWRAIPPFFWDASGRAAVHGAVTSGLKFCGDEFFMNLIAAPDECLALIRWLTEVTLVLVDHFTAVGGVTISGIHVGECAACMLDEEVFRRFVVPATSLLGDRWGHVRFHSCGRSDHLITACRDIRQLASLDVGGETSVAQIRAAFGDAFPVSIAPLVEDMTAATPGRILAWFDRVREENAGGQLHIGFHVEADYNLDTIRALCAAVRGEAPAADSAQAFSSGSRTTVPPAASD
jgi:hypothetical protein